jgi:hypothetical protein
MSDDIRVVPTTEAHVEGLQRCVDAVARERRWLGFLEGPPLAATHAFVDSILRGAERIELEVFASNARALALYDKLGFVREGVRRRARKLGGEYDDVVLMAIVG